MSHHIVHVLTHGARIAVERGQLTCIAPDAPPKRLPVADLRAVVIAARGVSITADAMGALLDADAIMLHCNAHYKPCGISVSLSRVASHAVFLGQLRPRPNLNDRIWMRILARKVANQSACLRRLNSPSPYLENAAKNRNLHEGNCARRYWKHFFAAIGHRGHRRRSEDDSGPDRLLNYGYAVLSALCHRSLLVHGLVPQMGVHHRSRYKAFPLVYDIVEPFRPFVDWLLAEFVREAECNVEAWAKTIGQALRDHRVECASSRIKLMDAVDKAAASLAQCYAQADAARLWLPVL